MIVQLLQFLPEDYHHPIFFFHPHIMLKEATSIGKYGDTDVTGRARRPDIDERIKACLSTRESARQSLVAALTALLQGGAPFSERMLHAEWLRLLQEEPNLYPNGWYVPPPNGLIVVFGTDGKPGRLNADSFRPRETWARDDVYFHRKHGLMMLYASPVEKSLGVAGDFQCTLYAGDNPYVREHLVRSLNTNLQVFGKLYVGMPLRDVVETAMTIMAKFGIESALRSTTDSASGINVGHTMPGVLHDWSPAQMAALRSPAWEGVAGPLFKASRVFVSTNAAESIQPGMVFSLEPRPQVPGRPDIPMASFHTLVVVWSDGRMELIADFDELFKLIGMDYMP